MLSSQLADILFLFDFKRCLVRGQGGGQFSEAGLNGALMKKKRQRQKMVQLSITKSSGGSIWLRYKVPFKTRRKLSNIMLAPQVQRKRVPDLGSAEPERALVLSCPS